MTKIMASAVDRRRPLRCIACNPLEKWSAAYGRFFPDPHSPMPAFAMAIRACTRRARLNRPAFPLSLSRFLLPGGLSLLLSFSRTTARAQASASSDSSAPLAVEKAASEWVKVRAETVRVETEWENEQGLLASTVEELKQRATKLEDSRDHLRAKTADERAELAALQAKKDAGAAEIAAARERLVALGERLRALRPKLPPRLAEALEFSFRSLEDPELGESERMQLTMTILNRCGQFNAAVSSGEEVLQPEGEPTPKALETIYWGLSHGYALDRASRKAWIGAPGATQWSWTANPDAFEPAAKLIEIFNDKLDPELVVVPARIAGNPQR